MSNPEAPTNDRMCAMKEFATYIYTGMILFGAIADVNNRCAWSDAEGRWCMFVALNPPAHGDISMHEYILRESAKVGSNR